MSASSPISPTKPKSETYNGSCHCGTVKFTMKISPPVDEGVVTSCNCTICTAQGYLMIYPLESNITWLSGKETMTTYTFGKRQIDHSFCAICGTNISAKSNDPNFFANNRAINVRVLEGVDMEKLQLRKVDGRSR